MQPKDNMNTRIQGKIKQLNSKKGYGFITSLELPFEKIYFYWEWLNQNTKRFPELKEGDVVTFELVKRENGYQAYHIDVLNRNAPHEDVEGTEIKEADTERIK